MNIGLHQLPCLHSGIKFSELEIIHVDHGIESHKVLTFSFSRFMHTNFTRASFLEEIIIHTSLHYLRVWLVDSRS